MTFAHRLQWAYGFAAGATTLAYVVWLALQLRHTPAADVDYVPALLWTLGASFVIHALGRGAAAGARRGDRVADERDRAVATRGDALTFYVFSVLAAVFGVVTKSVLYAKGA